jgi:hypothetical protein
MAEMQDNTEAQEAIPQANTNFIQDIESGARKVTDLSSEELDQFLSQSMYEPEEQIAPTYKEALPEAPAVEESSSTKDIKEAIWKAQVEANRWKQKNEAAQRKAQELENKIRELNGTSEKKSFSKPENYDPYAEENLNEIPIIKQEFASLREELQALKEERKRETLAQIEKERYNIEVDQLHTLQDEFPELKTSKPFFQVEEDYANWYNSLGTENANRYMSDPQFRASMDAKGFKVPADYDNYVALHGIRNSYKEGRYPSMRAAFRDSHLYDQLVERKYSNRQPTVQNNAQEKAVDRLAEIQRQTPILNTTQSSTPIEKMVMTEKEVMRELQNLGSKKNLNSQEQARLNSIYEQLGIN